MTVTSQPDQHSSAGAPDLAQLLRPVVRESSVSEVAKRLLDHLSAGDIRPGTR
ncbi:GntR family transcriptional regulator, partial [Streptomyces tendae]